MCVCVFLVPTEIFGAFFCVLMRTSTCVYVCANIKNCQLCTCVSVSLISSLYQQPNQGQGPTAWCVVRR